MVYFALVYSGQKDLNSEDYSFLTDNEEDFLFSLLVPRTLTSVCVCVEGRESIPIGVSTHAFMCSNVLTSFKNKVKGWFFFYNCYLKKKKKKTESKAFY